MTGWLAGWLAGQHGLHGMKYLEMFHEDSDDDVDKHELRHQDEHDEEDRRNDTIHAAVAHTVGRLITVLAQCVLPPRNIYSSSLFVSCLSLRGAFTPPEC